MKIPNLREAGPNSRKCLQTKNKKTDSYLTYLIKNKLLNITIDQYQSSNLNLLFCEILSLILFVFINSLSLYLKDIKGFCLSILPNIFTFSFYISSICFFRTVTFNDLLLSIPSDFLFFLLILFSFSNSILFSLSISVYFPSIIEFFLGFSSNNVLYDVILA